MSVIGFVDSVGRDLRHALRTLPRRPTFTFAAMLTLALGIGATTAIFSVVYSVLIKPLPYPNSDELVRIRHNAAALNTDDLGSSPTMYFTYRDENRTLAEIGFWANGGETLTRTDGTERVRSLRVTHGVLQALGVQPQRGRWFTEAEHAPEAEGPDPIILSYAFAQSRFGGDEAALGRDLLINGRPAQVVGIMPRDFRFLDMSPPFEIIVAMRIDPARVAIGGFGFDALARLKPGVTPAEASADLQRMVPIWLDAWPMVQGYSVTREAIAELADHARRAAAQGRHGRRHRERALGAHGRDRRGAARRVRQHREPHARARRCAAAGARRARRARRRAGTHRPRAARREPS